MKLLLLLILSLLKYATSYKIGVGKSDITGPVVETNMMGYAKPEQINNGIHMRLYSKAFLIKDDLNTIIYISVDQGMVSQSVKTSLIEKIQKEISPEISRENVMISATHTHSGPAGFFQYLLYDITSLGSIQQSHDAFVDGIFKSVKMAFDSKQEGKIFHASGELLNTSVNRSPYSYEFNPKEERDNYKHNTDKMMNLLKFVSSDGTPIGMLNWYPVHGVSMNNTNTLTSSDNKGLASMLFENEFKPKYPNFVGAFAQANEGDNSPNIMGAKCIDTGKPCDFKTSTCNGSSQKCIAFGPGNDMFESTKIIGENQFKKAMELWEKAETEITGPIEFVGQTIDMTNVEVKYDPREEINPSMSYTCKPAMGYSFAAGTTDGPGAFDFVQGMNKGTKLWDLVKKFIKSPSKKMVDCQKPKPVLLAVGELKFPYDWVPTIVETQIIKIGKLILVGLPGEFTTMSGRRVRTAVKRILWGDRQNDCFRKECNTPNEEIVVLSGLSNTYTSYITTYEEYQVQRYEGASTMYGENTLQAYIQQFEMLTQHLIKHTKPTKGPALPNFFSRTLSFITPVIMDTHPIGENFGKVTLPPKSVYQKDETVIVEFVGANPRNNMMLDSSFIEILKKEGDGFKIFKTDTDWETKFIWSRRGFSSKILGRSVVRVEWTVTDIKGVCTSGTFKIKYNGTSKQIFRLYNFTGESKEFNVKCHGPSLPPKLTEYTS